MPKGSSGYGRGSGGNSDSLEDLIFDVAIDLISEVAPTIFKGIYYIVSETFKGIYYVGSKIFKGIYYVGSKIFKGIYYVGSMPFKGVHHLGSKIHDYFKKEEVKSEVEEEPKLEVEEEPKSELEMYLATFPLGGISSKQKITMGITKNNKNSFFS